MREIKLFLMITTLLCASSSFANNIFLKCRVSENIEIDTQLMNKINDLGKKLKDNTTTDSKNDLLEIVVSQLVKGAMEIDYITRIENFTVWSGTSKEVEVTGTLKESEP